MSDEIRSVSPSDPEDEVGRFPVADAEDIAAAVERSRTVFPIWRDAGFETRAAILRSFRNAVNEEAEELARLISREMGKALWEARAEAESIGAKVDVTLQEGMRLVAPIEVGPGVRASHHPRGVLSVLGPFNFPAHLPNGHIVPALATGNTVVLKPSEIAPATSEWLTARWRRAGLPEGVLEVVHGAAETGRALATHPDVDAVLFTGSYLAGRALREATLDQPGKLLALEMGGNNAVVVLADADLDLAVSETAFSIAATTGQRCTGAGRVFVARELIDAFQEKLVCVLRGLQIGSPFASEVFMGPLASHAAHDRLLAARTRLDHAGGERVLCAVPELPPPYVGPGLVRFESTEQSHPAQREEIFGPEAALYPIGDLEHAIAAANNSEYGLAAAVFTRDRAQYEACIGRIRCGGVNWNKATVGASGRLPFGGGGRSGNDRPAGIAATVYCTFPQAHIENEADFDPEGLPPGMPSP